jgi:hypothetical protein
MADPPPPKAKRKSPAIAKGTGTDAERARDRLGGFDCEKSDTFRLLREHFGETIKTNEIRSIADLLCDKVPGLKLDRLARRDGRVLIKWFEENMTLIRPALDCIDLRDASEKIIGKTNNLS